MSGVSKQNDPTMGEMVNELEEMKQAASDISKILDKIKQVTEGLRFDKEYDQHFLLVSLHGSIMEMTYNCMWLLNIGTITCIPIIVRSMIEALSAMSLIANDRANIQEILDIYHLQRHKQALELIKLDLPQQDIEKLKAISEECIEKYKASKDTRGRPLPISERIEKTLGPLFSVAYKMHCSDAHNDIVALESRHVIKDDSGNYRFEFFRESSLRDCIPAIDAMLCCLLISTEIISKNVTSRKKEKIKNAIHKFKRFKRKYFPQEIASVSRPFEIE